MFDSIINILGSNILLTAYVTGNNSFPKPLKAEEEKYYLKQLEKGDISAKGVLIERNLRLVAHIVKKYSFPGKDMDDLISIGTIGLIKAIDSFKIDRGTRLATYAAKCIENEILMLIRNNKKTKGEVYLQDPIGIDKEGNEISLMDVLGTDEDAIVDIVEYRIKLKKLYEKIDICLTEREKAVIEMRYGLVDGGIKTQREIAEILGISRSYVSRIEKRSLKKLCKEMQKP
ncbi:RNA polymerase sporulation sigma factor SigK [Clostridium tetani]|nr:RNA polymerase sporulation sigma factor SigK [Clostridium tetani]RXI55174.1 RNA polymerase sporulation sigma factor SigK [Clostridium tetani]RXM79648.1 RNA polymerase sporulation sigma factor SigK [Clostridium tetani]RYV00462.1 RNA polymerase sporulation sigma factor SigK [Clostridium tetani]